MSEIENIEVYLGLREKGDNNDLLDILARLREKLLVVIRSELSPCVQVMGHVFSVEMVLVSILVCSLELVSA